MLDTGLFSVGTDRVAAEAEAALAATAKTAANPEIASFQLTDFNILVSLFRSTIREGLQSSYCTAVLRRKIYTARIVTRMRLGFAHAKPDRLLRKRSCCKNYRHVVTRRSGYGKLATLKRVRLNQEGTAPPQSSLAIAQGDFI